MKSNPPIHALHTVAWIETKGTRGHRGPTNPIKRNTYECCTKTKYIANLECHAE